MDVEGNSWDYPADLLVEILLRLPTSARRRARLVCRLWRDAVDDGTPEMRSRAKTLVCTKKSTGTAAYVIDDLPAGRFRELWTGGGSVSVVGTCNGLLCLCDDREPGGAITLINPVNGDTLAVPPLPRYSSGEMAAAAARWHEAYSFGYHPTTGRYKIVHVPCYLNPAAAGRFDAVQVFTLGEASSSSPWRDVTLPVPAAASCRLGAGIVSVDGATHWLTIDEQKVMSFDLKDERLTVKPLPAVPAKRRLSFRLMVARGRMAVAVDVAEMMLIKTKVWVLERRRWRRRYDVEVSGQRLRLTVPHFADGEHVLTTDDWWTWHSPAGISSAVYGHRMSHGDVRKRLVPCGVMQISRGERSSAAVAGRFKGNIDRTFAYVETTEPLSIYERSEGFDSLKSE